MIPTLFLGLCLLLLPLIPIQAQQVSIDHQTQRFLGTVSELERSRYFNLHSAATNDPDVVRFMNDYNVSTGRRFWGPFAHAKQQTGTVGVYPPDISGNNNVRPAVKNMVATAHPKDVIRWNIDKTTAANWVVEYYKDYVTEVPEFLEPMNEPFVHAGDPVFAAQQPDAQLMIGRMAEWFQEIGHKVHAEPALSNMKVIGFSDAWPSYEFRNFDVWNSRMKLFMDVAGDDMDAFATHLYDGINVVGSSSQRSGSNSEAILDMIEAYSFIKWGYVKPHAITEYGGIESGYPAGYSDIKNVQSVRSINHMIFNLLERENDLAISIPFIVDKALWHITPQNNYEPYGAVLFRPTNLGQPNPTGWVYTPRIHFYDMWKEVKGKRVLVESDHADIQIQAFVDGNKMYVALNNLDDATHEVTLDFLRGLTGLQQVQMKNLRIYTNQQPQFNNQTFTSAPKKVTLISGETAVLTYTFNQALTFNNAIRSQKYYSTSYLQPITTQTPINFTINNVTTGTGRATLRIGLGRYHNNNVANVSKRPVVTINGTTIAVPSNWKGYDQANRPNFMGLLEIPMPMELLQANNAITVTFPDNGGYVTSVVLQVEKYDTPVPSQSAYPAGVPHLIPGTVQAEEYDLGGAGLAYKDGSTANYGATVANFRTTEQVDVTNVNHTPNGDYTVGWTQKDEWLEYTVEAARTAKYRATIHYSAGSNHTGEIYLAFNNERSDVLSLAPTGGWKTQSTVSTDMELSEGRQVMRIYIKEAGIDIDKVVFTLLPPDHDRINIVNAPARVLSSTAMTFNLSYEASTARDLVLEIWSNGWKGQVTQPVPAGYGETPVTINLLNPLPAGNNYSLKASIRPSNGNWQTAIDRDNKGIVLTQPYGGTVATIPGSVQAENYDLGGEGIGYHDLDPTNNGGAYRTDAVDIEPTQDAATNGGYNIGWMSTSEWLEYTVNCTATQTYDLYARVASPYNFGRLKFYIDGEAITDDLVVPNTGAWQAFQTMRVKNIPIAAGNHVIRVEVVAGGVNLNDWAFWPVPANQSPAGDLVENQEEETIILSVENQTNEPSLSIYPNPSFNKQITIEIKEFNQEADLEVYDAQGRLLKTHVLTHPLTSLSLEQFSAGIYWIKTTVGTQNLVEQVILH